MEEWNYILFIVSDRSTEVVDINVFVKPVRNVPVCIENCIIGRVLGILS